MFGFPTLLCRAIRSDNTTDDSPKQSCRHAAQNAVKHRTKQGALEPRLNLRAWFTKPWRPEDKPDRGAADRRRDQPEHGAKYGTAETAQRFEHQRPPAALASKDLLGLRHLNRGNSGTSSVTRTAAI